MNKRLPHLRKFLTRGLVAILVVTIIVIASLLIWLTFINIESHRSSIEKLLRDSTQQQVSINGEIALDLSLRPEMVIQDIYVANPDWAKSSHLAKIDQLRVSIELMALLQNEINILQFELNGVELHIEKNEQGALNIQYDSTSTADSGAIVIPSIMSLDINDLRSFIHFVDRPTTTIELDTLHAVLAMNEPLQLYGQVEYDHVPIAISINGDNLAALLEKDSKWNMNGNFSIESIKLDVAGHVRNLEKIDEILLTIEHHPVAETSFKTRLGWHDHDFGRLSATVRIKNLEQGPEVELNFKGNDLNLTRHLTEKKRISDYGVKINTLSVDAAATGSTLDELISNSVVNYSLSDIEVLMLSSNDSDINQWTIDNINIQAIADKRMETQVNARINKVPVTLRAQHNRLIDLVLSENPWPISANIKSKGVETHIRTTLLVPLQDNPVSTMIDVKVDDAIALGKLTGVDIPALGPFSFKSNIDYDSQKFEIRDIESMLAETRFNGHATIDIHESELISVAANITNKGTEAILHATIPQPITDKPVRGTLSVKSDDIRSLEQLAGTQLPPLGALTMQTDIDYHDNQMRFSNIETRIAESTLSGEVQLNTQTPNKLTLDLALRDFKMANFDPELVKQQHIDLSADTIYLKGSANGISVDEMLQTGNWQLSIPDATLRRTVPNEPPNQRYLIRDLTVENIPADKIALKSKILIGELVVQLDGTTGELGLLLQDGQDLPTSLKLASSSTSVSFDGHVHQPLSSPALSGEFTLHATDLVELGQFTGLQKDMDRTVTATGDIHYRNESLNVNGMDIISEGLQVNADLSLTATSSPKINAQIHNSIVDLLQFKQNSTSDSATRTTGTTTDPAPARLLTAQLHFDKLKDVSLQLDFDDVLLKAGSTDINTLKGKLLIDNGKLTLDPFHSKSVDYDSYTDALLTVDTHTTPPAAHLNISLNQLNYGALLNDLRYLRNVEGMLDFELEIQGQGDDLAELLSNSDGRMQFVSSEGVVPRRLLELWGAGLFRMLDPRQLTADTTQLNCAVGKFAIEDGYLKSETLLADTEALTIAGELVINLETEQIDGVFQSRPKHVTFFRLGDPIKLSGTLSNPQAGMAKSKIFTIGKWAIGLSNPYAMIVVFGDLGSGEKNPCAALLEISVSEQ